MKRSLLILAGLLLALGVVNASILRYERLLDHGVPVLLELAPVDPRSLMQGDYMRLRFALSDEIAAARRAAGLTARSGYAVLRPDARAVATFVRLQDEASPLQPGEVALRYRVRRGAVLVASDAFFFAEGRAAHFAAARYGELRVADDGTALLAALRDAGLGAL